MSRNGGLADRGGVTVVILVGPSRTMGHGMEERGVAVKEDELA